MSSRMFKFIVLLLLSATWGCLSDTNSATDESCRTCRTRCDVITSEPCPAEEKCSFGEWGEPLEGRFSAFCGAVVPEPAAIGEACETYDYGLDSCVRGSDCINGVCVAICAVGELCEDGSQCVESCYSQLYPRNDLAPPQGYFGFCDSIDAGVCDDGLP